jgi:release factor glutamine methyltransferase
LTETWAVLKTLQWTTGYFREKGIEGGRLDAELLLAHVLGLDRVGLYLQFDRPLNTTELTEFRGLVGRRARREPLQYILGKVEFWSLSLHVSPAVLIPRPDTELLVAEALKRAPEAAAVLDVGTGSGAIAIALAHERPDLTVTALDLSSEALAVAEGNARQLGVAARMAFHQGDLGEFDGGPFDLIVANPPYIPAADLADLMPEVRDFEPLQALDGGADGLACYRRLLPMVERVLTSGGWLLLEIGIDQAPFVQAMLRDSHLFADPFTARDLSGIERVVGARRSPRTHDQQLKD